MEMFRQVLFSVLLASAIAQFARGDSPKITAVLTSSEVVVGETVQLQIQIDNAGTSVKPPSEIDVPGLQIHFTGKSTADDDGRISQLLPRSPTTTRFYRKNREPIKFRRKAFASGKTICRRLS